MRGFSLLEKEVTHKTKKPGKTRMTSLVLSYVQMCQYGLRL